MMTQLSATVESNVKRAALLPTAGLKKNTFTFCIRPFATLQSYVLLFYLIDIPSDYKRLKIILLCW
jgi:hypothetical protein